MKVLLGISKMLMVIGIAVVLLFVIAVVFALWAAAIWLTVYVLNSLSLWVW